MGAVAVMGEGMAVRWWGWGCDEAGGGWRRGGGMMGGSGTGEDVVGWNGRPRNDGGGRQTSVHLEVHTFFILVFRRATWRVARAYNADAFRRLSAVLDRILLQNLAFSWP